jgi:hypothetical protein
MMMENLGKVIIVWSSCQNSIPPLDTRGIVVSDQDRAPGMAPDLSRAV